MGAEDVKKIESDESTSNHSRSEDDETSKEDSTKKSLALLPEEKVIDCDETKLQDPTLKKKFEDSVSRDDQLVHVITQKKLALVKAWEESQKTKAYNRANKKVSAIGSWKDSKNATVDAELMKIEEKYERKKAQDAEKLHNKRAEIHKKAEEKKAHVDAQRSQSILKIQESAAKFRATGKLPKKVIIKCFSFRSNN